MNKPTDKLYSITKARKMSMTYPKKCLTEEVKKAIKEINAQIEYAASMGRYVTKYPVDVRRKEFYVELKQTLDESEYKIETSLLSVDNEGYSNHQILTISWAK